MNKFDNIHHQYYIDDQIVPSVTRLLPKQEFFVSPEQLEAARQDGINNHKSIDIYFNTGRETFNDPDLIAYDKMIKENQGVLGDFIQHEIPLYSKKLKFAGTPDAIFSKAIIDNKRSAGNTNYHALQLAGYLILARENKIISSTTNLFIAYPKKSGYKLKSVFNAQAEDIFISLIRKYYIEDAVAKFLKN